MSKFLRHIGKHGDRKVAVVFREVPGEPHMALVVYTELLNRHIHDPLMAVIDSDAGQQSQDLADALSRNYSTDGRPLLNVLHMEGMIKKVQTELVVMTPGPNIQIRLNELNAMLNKIEQGEEAVREMEELDKSTGLQSPMDVARRMREGVQKRKPGDPIPGIDTPASVPSTDGASTDVLDNSALANNLRSQADRMLAEARSLMAEAERMKQEAASLMPAPILESTPEAKPSKKAGRPKKTVAA